MLHASKKIVPVLAVTILIAALAVGIWSFAAAPAGAAAAYTPQLSPATAAGVRVASLSYGSLGGTTAKRIAPVPVITKSGSVGTVSGARSIRSGATRTSGGSSAQSILNGLIAKHPILAGVTVEFGDARGYQAIALYQSGRIIISPTHTASLERILNHEVWHIIDWRDNGRIDWGENVPPK